MAVLQKPVADVMSGLFDIPREPLPPAGTYVATILDVRDKMGVTRTKYQSTETETVDLTAFLFGYRGTDGKPYRIDTRPMKISGHPKSALYKFLTSLLGKSPEYGWDYAALKGTKCMLTVAHLTGEKTANVYAAVSSVSPLPAGGLPPPVATPPPPPPEIRLADDDDLDEEIPF